MDRKLLLDLIYFFSFLETRINGYANAILLSDAAGRGFWNRMEQKVSAGRKLEIVGISGSST